MSSTTTGALQPTGVTAVKPKKKPKTKYGK